MANSAFTVTGGSSGGGAMTLLASLTAANSANISFTTDITNLFRTYLVYVNNVTASVGGGVLYLNTSTNGGISYDNGVSNYIYSISGTTGGAILNATVTPTTNFIVAGQAAGGFAIDTIRPMSATVTIYDPTAATYTTLQSTCSGYTFAGTGIWQTSGGIRNSASGGINALRFTISTGNISTGIFNLYGIS